MAKAIKNDDLLRENARLRRLVSRLSDLGNQAALDSEEMRGAWQVEKERSESARKMHAQALTAYNNLAALIDITKPERIQEIFRKALEDVFIRRAPQGTAKRRVAR